MSRASVKDPLGKFRWSVRIENFERAGFTEVSAPGYTISTKTYREGGAHLFPKKILDTIEYKPVTLSRGATTNRDFLNWAKGPFTVLGVEQDRALAVADKGDGDFTDATEGLELAEDFRRDVFIDHLNRQGDRVRTYRLRKAFVVDYQVASDFASDADDTVSIEKIVLAYESFEVETIDVTRNPFSARGLFKRLVRRF